MAKVRMRTTRVGREPTFVCQTNDFGEYPPPPPPPGPADGSLAAVVAAVVGPVTPLASPLKTPAFDPAMYTVGGNKGAPPSMRRLLRRGRMGAPNDFVEVSAASQLWWDQTECLKANPGITESSGSLAIIATRMILPGPAAKDGGHSKFPEPDSNKALKFPMDALFRVYRIPGIATRFMLTGFARPGVPTSAPKDGMKDVTPGGVWYVLSNPLGYFPTDLKSAHQFAPFPYIFADNDPKDVCPLFKQTAKGSRFVFVIPGLVDRDIHVAHGRRTQQVWSGMMDIRYILDDTYSTKARGVEDPHHTHPRPNIKFTFKVFDPTAEDPAFHVTKGQTIARSLYAWVNNAECSYGYARQDRGSVLGVGEWKIAPLTELKAVYGNVTIYKPGEPPRSAFASVQKKAVPSDNGIRFTGPQPNPKDIVPPDMKWGTVTDSFAAEDVERYTRIAKNPGDVVPVPTAEQKKEMALTSDWKHGYVLMMDTQNTWSYVQVENRKEGSIATPTTSSRTAPCGKVTGILPKLINGSVVFEKDLNYIKLNDAYYVIHHMWMTPSPKPRDIDDLVYIWEPSTPGALGSDFDDSFSDFDDDDGAASASPPLTRARAGGAAGGAIVRSSPRAAAFAARQEESKERARQAAAATTPRGRRRRTLPTPPGK